MDHEGSESQERQLATGLGQCSLKAFSDTLCDVHNWHLEQLHCLLSYHSLAFYSISAFLLILIWRQKLAHVFLQPTLFLVFHYHASNSTLSLFFFFPSSAPPLSLWVNAVTLVFLCLTEDRRWDMYRVKFALLSSLCLWTDKETLITFA